jgi:multiple sugar transport system ATP-binding protein
VADVELRAIAKSFGQTPVLKGVDLAVKDGEFLALVGPSGCGKSTLLRIIAGLEAQDHGAVSIGGRPVDHLRPHERRAAMVFQNYALYPHMSVFDNMALPLVMARHNLFERLPLLRHLSPRRRRIAEEIAREVRAVGTQLQIDQLFARRPWQLSGGQRQRVALGRAMVRQPDVFLMDEPLSNLDAKLRVHMRTELAELHARLGATIVYVTHDQVEAMTMANRLAVMEAGSILQLGTPSELYERPSSIAVAQFIGSPAINLVPGRIGANGQVELLDRPLPLTVAGTPGAPVTIAVRPEAVHVSGAVRACALAGRLRRRENLGSETILHFDLAATPGTTMVCRIAHDGGAPLVPTMDGELMLRFDAEACHVFDSEGRRMVAQAASTRPADGIAPISFTAGALR